MKNPTSKLHITPLDKEEIIAVFQNRENGTPNLVPLKYSTPDIVPTLIPDDILHYRYNTRSIIGYKM